MIAFIGRGGHPHSSLQFWQSARKTFHKNPIRLSGPLDVLETNGLEVHKDEKPSEVYRQKVQAGELTEDPHQEKVVAQVRK